MHKPVTFKDWLKTKSGRIYVAVSGVFTLGFSAFQALKIFGIEKIPLPTLQISDERWLTINFAIQVAFISYVVFFTAYSFANIDKPDKVNENEENIWQRLELHDPTSASSSDEENNKKQEAWVMFKNGANKVVKQFTWFWLLGWFSWLIHYVYMLCGNEKWLTTNVAGRNLLNNVNSLMFVFLFMTLTVSTSKYGALFWSKLFCLVLGVFALEWLAYKLTQGNKVVALSFTIFSGLFASTALAAFVGSINSKFINIPVGIIPVLYLYAAIQSLYVFFELTGIESNVPVFVQRTEILVTVLAFFLKTVLFIVVTWVLRTGRLVYFIIEESSLNFRRDKNFEEFLGLVKITETKLT